MSRSLLIAFATIGAYTYEHFKSMQAIKLDLNFSHMAKNIIEALENNYTEETLEDFYKLLQDSHICNKYDLKDNN